MRTEKRGGVRTSLTKKLSTENITKQLKITIMKATKTKKKMPLELIILLVTGVPFFLFQLIRFLIQNL